MALSSWNEWECLHCWIVISKPLSNFTSMEDSFFLTPSDSTSQVRVPKQLVFNFDVPKQQKKFFMFSFSPFFWPSSFFILSFLNLIFSLLLYSYLLISSSSFRPSVRTFSSFFFVPLSSFSTQNISISKEFGSFPFPLPKGQPFLWAAFSHLFSTRTVSYHIVFCKCEWVKIVSELVIIKGLQVQPNRETESNCEK